MLEGYEVAQYALFIFDRRNGQLNPVVVAVGVVVENLAGEGFLLADSLPDALDSRRFLLAGYRVLELR